MVYYEYDNKRRLRKVTLNGTETEYTHDGNDEVTESKSAGNTFKTIRDADGNVIRTEINGAVQTEYEYEAGLLNRFGTQALIFSAAFKVEIYLRHIEIEL